MNYSKAMRNPEDLLGQGGILKQLTAALVERCLNAEMKNALGGTALRAGNRGIEMS
jgi:transposase-like protein